MATSPDQYPLFNEDELTDGISGGKPLKSASADKGPTEGNGAFVAAGNAEHGDSPQRAASARDLEPDEECQYCGHPKGNPDCRYCRSYKK